MTHRPKGWWVLHFWPTTTMYAMFHEGLTGELSLRAKRGICFC